MAVIPVMQTKSKESHSPFVVVGSYLAFEHCMIL